jgi:hypothetical protein
MIYRGNRFLSVSFGRFRLTFLRSWLWLGPGWNGWGVVGGCLIVRFGPCVVDVR